MIHGELENRLFRCTCRAAFIQQLAFAVQFRSFPASVFAA
jgi:hypothetical protein